MCDTNNNLPAEPVNIIFCILLLGVNKRAVEQAVIGEIGKYHIAVGLIIHSLKFWLRTVNCDSSTLA